MLGQATLMRSDDNNSGKLYQLEEQQTVNLDVVSSTLTWSVTFTFFCLHKNV